MKSLLIISNFFKLVFKTNKVELSEKKLIWGFKIFAEKEYLSRTFVSKKTFKTAFKSISILRSMSKIKNIINYNQSQNILRQPLFAKRFALPSLNQCWWVCKLHRDYAASKLLIQNIDIGGRGGGETGGFSRFIFNFWEKTLINCVL